MHLINLKAYVINLKRRPDRLALFQREMEFMGLDYEVFDAIDTNSYLGCALSHVEIAKRMLAGTDEWTLVFEDDVFFMPYAKDMLDQAMSELYQRPFDLFHLGPSVHRPLNMSGPTLVNLTNLPPRDESRHRGIFGTGAMLYNRQVAEYIVEYATNKFIDNTNYMIAIDQFFDSVIYPRCISYAPRLPVCSQQNGYSDINHGLNTPHYIITYNWNAYVSKLPTPYFDLDNCIKMRSNGETSIP